jgi:membrane protein DedA with SNARE-associated domain
VLLISAGYYLGTQWTRIEEHIDVINNIIYVTIGVAIGVFFMRRWAHRRRQPRAAD